MPSISKVCALTVAYNNSSELGCLLRSLKEQSNKIDGIVVVDNSTKDDIAMKNKYLFDFSAMNLSFEKYIFLQQNKGSAHGFKLGMQIAYEEGFDWIWLLDQDGIVAPDCLEALLKYDDKAFVLCPIVYSLTDHNKILGFRAVKNLWGNVKMIYKNDKELIPINVFGTHGVLINRAAIDETGFYDDKNFFCAWEDFDYSFRLSKNNIKILQVSSAKVYHPDHTSGQKWGKLRLSSKLFLTLNTYFPMPPFLGYLSKNKEGREGIMRETLFNLHKKHLRGINFWIELFFSLSVVVILKITGRPIDFSSTLTKYYELASERLLFNR